MPGSPKTQRTRETHEKPKATKVSRVGSVMRCGKCKCTGHNSASCDKRSGKNQSAGAASDNFSSGNFGAAPSPAPAPTSSVPAAAPSPTPSTHEASISTKRKLSVTIGSQDSTRTTGSMSKVPCQTSFIYNLIVKC